MRADGVVSMDALPFAKDRDAAFRELARILRPGARAVFTVAEALPGHPRYNPQGPRMSDRIARAGLEIEHELERPEESVLWLRLYELWEQHEAELRTEIGDEATEQVLIEANGARPHMQQHRAPAPDRARMRILIIGGGIAGSATALALHKAGFDPIVYEAHPEAAEDLGAFLTLASNGMRALAQIDADAIVADAGFPLTQLRVIDASGATVADAPLGEHEHPLTQYRCLRRADLAAALQRETERRGIAIKHGARLHAFNETTDGATATFTDGSSATGDLLIGADGLNSAVRPLLSTAIEPRYAGQRVFYGYTTEAPAETSGHITMIRGSGAAFGYACSPGGETYWFARVSGPPVPADELAATTAGQWRDQLVPLLRPDATPAADIVQATADRLMITNACDLPVGITWRTPRALIIGDAAHAASPATGQGASMALEDAVVLAKALRDAPTAAAGLTAYEELRRPRVEHNILASAELTAGRRPSPQGAPAPNDDLQRQLDWTTPLPA